MPFSDAVEPTGTDHSSLHFASDGAGTSDARGDGAGGAGREGVRVT